MKKFTLIELLIVISIIGILLTLLLPSLRNARTRALATLCISNQKQIAVAFYSYGSSNDSFFPYSPQVKADSLPATGFNPGNGRPTMQVIWNEAGENNDVFVCPLDPSPEDYEFWYFQKRPNFKNENARASYMFNEWPVWMYAKHFRKQLKFSHVTNSSEWPLISDGRVLVHGGEKWSRGNILSTGWKAVDWNHHRHQIGMTYGDGHVKHVNSHTAGMIEGRPEY